MFGKKEPRRPTASAVARCPKETCNSADVLHGAKIFHVVPGDPPDQAAGDGQPGPWASCQVAAAAAMSEEADWVTNLPQEIVTTPMSEMCGKCLNLQLCAAWQGCAFPPIVKEEKP
jgi:hypothetical protein